MTPKIYESFILEIHAASMRQTDEYAIKEWGQRLPIFKGEIDFFSIDACLGTDDWDMKSKALILEERALALEAYKAGNIALALSKMDWVQLACKSALERQAVHKQGVNFKRDAALKESKLKAKHSKKP